MKKSILFIMNARTKLLIAGSATALVLTGTSLTRAASPTNSSTNSLVSELAARFNVNKTDVQAVFDQNHQEQMAQHQKNETDSLNQAVANGTLTSSQRDLIVAKQAELKTKMTALKGETATTRQADIKKLMADTKIWATTNNIDLKWLHGGMNAQRGMNHGAHSASNTPRPTPAAQ